ncbi:MAG: Fused nickel transport protein NikMN [Pelotomaculum sp. PtaB.Bin104]|nr:MAG: Fused nickel transport protein NikMN [Pelotomaculum sp. PtaB.Bin104]
MHIPDGYLGLQTTLPAMGVMVPLWAAALRKVKTALSHRQMPLLSLCAAFSFVIMMFNVPLGESSVHAVGAVFIAILLGPWAACVAVSVALMIQALVFGDGGILSLGINCFNIAVIMPFTGYYLYRVVAGKSDILSKRSLFGVFAGSYVGLNLAALSTAIAFGIQPLLFKAADGTPLYGYYPLSVSVTAMMFEHLLFAGPIEGIITVAAISYLAKLAPYLLNVTSVREDEKGLSFWKIYKPVLTGLLGMVVLSPLGLLAAGTAWGEWSAEELVEKVGFIPEGYRKTADLRQALMPDYSIPGLDGSFFCSSLVYIASAVMGILIIGTVIFFTARLIIGEQESN